MKHIWNLITRQLAQAVALMALPVLMQGASSAQSPQPTLAFYPGQVTLVAGDPANGTAASPATYVGPANGLVPQSQGFFDAATDKYGNVYLSEAQGNIVRVIASGNGPIPALPSVTNPQVGYAYTVFGTGVNASGNALGATCAGSDGVGDGCLATQAAFSSGYGQGIAVDTNGNLYLADYNGIIRVVYAGQGSIPGLPANPTPGFVYSIAGSYGNGNIGTGTASTNPIGYPYYIAVDANGNIYFTTYNASNNVLLLAISVSGSLPGDGSPNIGNVYTIVGTGTLADSIQASTSSLGQPEGIAIDSFGNIYVTDQGVGEVRVIYAGGSENSVPGLINLIAGYIYKVAGGSSATTTPKAFTSTLVTNAQVVSPIAVAVDLAGDLYIADNISGGRVDKVDPSGNLTVVVGGAPDAQYSCASPVDGANDGCAADAPGNFNNFAAIALDLQGNIYIADHNSLLHESRVAGSSAYFTPGQSQLVTIYNPSAAALPLSNVTVSSPFTPVSTGSGDCSSSPTLQPGESCKSEIEAPSSDTTVTGTFSVASTATNSSDGTNTIQLTGESTANAALCKISLSLRTSPPNSIAAGTSENLTYQLSCGSSEPSNPSGTLTLYSNGTALTSYTQQVNLTSHSGTVTFSDVLFPTGNNLVYAVYSGDQYDAPSTSGQALITVSGTATTTAVQTPASTTVATGQSFSLTATVGLASGATAPSGEAAPNSGTVTFKGGSTVIGSAQVSGGSAILNTASISTAGSYPITAVYSGDDYYNTSTSVATVTITVSAPVNTTTAVAASTTAPAEGASVTLTATVTAASGTAAPTGSLQFQSNGTNIGGSVTLTSSGPTTATATLPVSNLPEGKDIITAAYSGSSDGLFVASQTTTASSTAINVGLPATTTTVTPPTGSITYGSSYAFTVTVAQQVGNTVPTGTVSFTSGSTPLGSPVTLSGGTATFTTMQLPGGSGTVTDTVTATYNDPTNAFASSTGTASVSVTPVGTTTSTPTSSNLNPVSGQTLTLTATVTAVGSSAQPTGTVTFYNGTTVLGSGALTSGTATYTGSLPQGVASITAVYVGGNGFQTSTSSALSLTVAPPSATTTTSLVASTNSLYTGQGVTFTATVTDTSGTVIPTGAVVFQSGSTQLGIGNLNGSGMATFTLTPSTAATYNVTAVYQGNSSFTGSTSSPAVTVTVSTALANSSTALSVSPAAAVQQGTPVTFTAAVASASTSVALTPTGQVTFYNGTNLTSSNSLGQATLYGGTATLSTTSLNPGSYSVTAVYSGDGNFGGSQSSAVALTVGAPTPSFTLTTTPNNLTLTSGQTGKAIITLTPTYAYTGTVALSCGTLPSNVTCSFSPATLTADGQNDAVQSTLTITTNGGALTSTSVRPAGPGQNAPSRLLAALFFLPVGLLGLGFTDKRKRLSRYLSLALLVFLGTGLLAISGCGGGNGGSSTDAAKGTAQITITGTGSAGSQTQTANITITIQ